MRPHAPSWDGGDEIVMLLALATVSMAGMIWAGPENNTAQRPADSQLEQTPEQNLSPPAEAQIPASSGAPIAVYDLPPSRPLAPGEQISEADSFIDVFGSRLNTRLWVEHESERDRGFWRNDFRKNKILTDADGMALEIGKQPEHPERPWPWAAGEINSRRKYGYGRYEALMSPAKGSGLVSAFFTYTGPYFGDPHDEIDIEFLGRRPNIVEFNMFRDGRPGGSYELELPFDATEQLNLYAFEWHPDAITWFVDGVPVHRVEATDYKLPRMPQYIYANIWTGKLTMWHGPANFEAGVTARFGCVSFQKAGANTRQCSDLFEAETPYRPTGVRFKTD
ncbi:MAG: family 16 glycosylhydrolase [Pseudomonadota bacterium]